MKTQKLYAVRNGARIENDNLTEQEWFFESENLLAEGFMVLVKPGVWSVLDSQGKVRFVKDDLSKGRELCS